MQVRVIRTENLIDQTVIIVDHIKNNFYKTKIGHVQIEPRKFYKKVQKYIKNYILYVTVIDIITGKDE